MKMLTISKKEVYVDACGGWRKEVELASVSPIYFDSVYVVKKYGLTLCFTHRSVHVSTWLSCVGSTVVIKFRWSSNYSLAFAQLLYKSLEFEPTASLIVYDCRQRRWWKEN